MIVKGILFILGVVFAWGLGISQMTRPQKILAFLDVLGNWDPSLLLVMAAAVGSYLPLQKLILRRSTPLYAEKFTLPKLTEIDPKLIAGAALFGIGWGLVGLCPGPSIVALASGHLHIVVFVAGMIIGMITHRLMKKEKITG